MTIEFKDVLHIGILGAMKEEVSAIKEHLYNTKELLLGDLKIFSGEIILNKNQEIKIYLTIAWSGWGKVSSARAATRLVGLNIKILG